MTGSGDREDLPPEGDEDENDDEDDIEPTCSDDDRIDERLEELFRRRHEEWCLAHAIDFCRRRLDGKEDDDDGAV